MIVEKQSEITVLEDTEEQQQSFDMTVDLESTQYIMQMLSKDLYSDPIGSLIRETASNALDSHRKAGVDDPIIVSLSYESSSGITFSVEDFGVGLDDKDVENIIRKYGKSTKRTSATELGLFGLGFKSPLSYTSSFYFIARKDGIERKYMMYQSDEVNKIDLLYESPTSERNGVKVIVPVGYSDRYSFIESIKVQLAYFEGVYFSFTGMVAPISNDFSIIRTEHYQMSELCNDGYMHICLDNVYYPLDFSQLGIDRIRVGIGLRFGLSDGIFPVPNREQIRYTKEAKIAILNKIATVCTEIIKDYNSSVSSDADVFSVIEYYNSSNRYWTFGKRSYEISGIEKFSSVKLAKLAVKGISLLDLSEYNLRDSSVISREYEQVAILRPGGSKWTEPRYDRLNLLNFNTKSRRIYLLDGAEGEMQKRNYIRATAEPYKTYHLLKLKAPLKLKGEHSYMNVLDLKRKPKDKWRDYIKEFQFYQSLIMQNVIKMSDVVIPQDWIDQKKKARLDAAKTAAQTRKTNSVKRAKVAGTLSCKVARDPEKYIGRNCVFDNSSIDLSSICKYKGMTFYTSHDKAGDMDKPYAVLKRKARFITFSERDMKIVSSLDIHNLKPIEYLMTKDCKPFRRIVTGHLIDKLIDEFNSTFERAEDSLKGILSPLCEKIEELKEYRDRNTDRSWGNKAIYDAMLEVAEVNNLYDFSIYSTYIEVRDMLRKYPFIELLMEELYIPAYGEHVEVTEMKRNIFRDVFKQNKIKMDAINYVHPKKVEEEELVEASVLTN